MALPGQQKRYYPVTQGGNLDEWGAVIKHHTEVYEREKNETELQYRKGQVSYHKDLEKHLHEKEANLQL